jgi:hypothetical protein
MSTEPELTDPVDDNRCPQTGCIYSKGHPADGKTVFSFHVAYEPKTGRRVSWTDNDQGQKRTRSRQKADPLPEIKFPQSREKYEVRACPFTTTPPGERMYQCEKAEGHEPNHVAHRSDGSLVVWS